MTTNLRLNKQLLAMTETNTSQSHNTPAEVGGPHEASQTSSKDLQPASSYTIAMQARLQGYQAREEAMQKQLDGLLKQRENDQA